MTKATAIACSNVALVKYMGRKDDLLRLPANGSVSMNLSECRTVTTVEFVEGLASDTFAIADQLETGSGAAKLSAHLDRLRVLARTPLRARVESRNTFPRGTGLSSSASGLAALTAAAAWALGLELPEAAMSILARQGSGSACRSIPGGFVEWMDGETSDDSYGVSRFPPEHWDLVDVVAVCTHTAKTTSSSETHLRVKDSARYHDWIACKPERIRLVLQAIAERSLGSLGPIVEQETEDLHALYESVGVTQRSSLAREVCGHVTAWRRQGLPAFYSLNTGQNVHVLTPASSAETVAEKLRGVPGVQSTIINHPGPGVRRSQEHLW